MSTLIPHRRVRRLCILAVLACALVPAGAAAARTPGPNGQLAFARYDPVLDDDALYTINPDGTHERKLLSVFGGMAHWSPDGSRLVSPVTESGPGATITNADDGSSVQVQPDDPNIAAFCYLWTPDAQRIACETFGASDEGRNGMYTIRSSDGGDVRQITSTPGGDDQPGDYSPDGRRLAFTHYVPCCPPDDVFLAKSGLFVVNVNGTGMRKIGPCCDPRASWSPQGNQIVFTRHVGDGVHGSIWVVHSDGSGLHEVDVKVPAGDYPCGARVSDPNSNPDSDPTVGGCFDPVWSPDGKKIVFVRGDSQLGRNIYTMNADGSGLTQVTNGDAGQSNETPDWGTHALGG